MTKTRVRFTVAYDGTDFCGWQRQNLHRETSGLEKPSLSRTLEKALEKVFQHPIDLCASGRTDAGVHAINQVGHFDTVLAPDQLRRLDLGRASKSFLPPTVVIKKAWIAPPDFHATLSAQKKTYRYVIYNAETPHPFLHRTMAWMYRPLDLDFLNSCSQAVLGEHDFRSFQSVGSDVPHTVRTIYRADWHWLRPRVAAFTITGSGFLKQMVRNIVGTQLLLARKNQPSGKMHEIMAKLDRRQAGPPADPQGLYLMRVYYPPDLDKRCLEL
jgi:tRNA pseudouridine38-40 synthase